jgi:hypothetical protein
MLGDFQGVASDVAEDDDGAPEVPKQTKQGVEVVMACKNRQGVSTQLASVLVSDSCIHMSEVLTLQSVSEGSLHDSLKSVVVQNSLKCYHYLHCNICPGSIIICIATFVLDPL